MAGAFIGILYQPINSLFHETDMWWMIPTIANSAATNSFWGALKIHMFNPYYTSWGEPTMNVYFFLIHQFIGFHAKGFIFAAVAMHLAASFLLYLVARELGLDFPSAFFASLVYMTAFIHFQYYIWPMSAHHRTVILFTLLVWYLYLRTTRLLYAGEAWRPSFRLTILANLLASFSQITILVLPVSVLAHILVCSKDNQDRIKRYTAWLPLFITYLGWPLMRLAYIRYPNIENSLHMSIPQIANPLLFPVIFVSGLTVLLLFRHALRLCAKYDFRAFFLRAAIIGAVLYSAIFLWAYWHRGALSPFHQRKVLLADFLSPYNFIRPFVGMLMSFLAPFKALSSADSAIPYYNIPLKPDLIYASLTVLFLVIFARRFLKKEKGFVIFFILYAIALPNMWRRGGIVASRHFVYITPLFSVIFASVSVHLCALMTRKISSKDALKDLVLIPVFIGLGVFNVLGIRLYMFEGRLPNTFFIYDYIKTAHAVKADIGSGGVDHSRIYIDNVQVMPFKEYWDCTADPLRFDTFRYTFAQVLRDDSMALININVPPNDAKTGLVYTLRGPRVCNSSGRDIDPFTRDFEDALKELKAGRYKEAQNLFQKAYERRPFLFNYVLGRYDLKDLGWMTNGRDMRKWTSDIVSYYDSWGERPIERSTRISGILKDEIDKFVECLFFLSYLKHLLGNPEEGRRIFYDIRFIDSSYDAVYRQLADESIVRSDRKMLAFLNDNINSLSSGGVTTTRLPSFLLKLVFNKDQIPF